MKSISVEELISLAKEVESEDTIDWGMLNIDENEAYKLIALNVLEMFGETEEDAREAIMLTTIVKLVVENFVLNLQLHQRNQHGS